MNKKHNKSPEQIHEENLERLRMNITLGQPFGDGAHILYVNGQYRGDSELGRLMHDFCCADPDEMNYKLFADKARYLKESREGVSAMCRAMEELRKEGVEEGIDFGKLSMAITYYKRGRISLEEAAADLGISTDEFVEEMNSFPGEAV